MVSEKKRISGKKSQKKGNAFEKLVMENGWRNKYSVIRIPNGSRRIGAHAIIPIKSPFDFVVVKKKFIVFLDAKTCGKKYFEHSSIKEKQIQHLYSLYLQEHVSGYLVRFELENKTVFFDAKLLKSRIGIRGSLKSDEGVCIGDSLNFNFDILFQSQF